MKKNYNNLTIAFTILLIFGSVIAVFRNRSNKVNEIPARGYLDLSQDNSITKEWNLYENKTLGFKIKYPPNVVINTESDSGVVFTLKKYKNNIQPLPVDLFIGIRGTIGSDPIDALKDESPLRNGQRLLRDYRLVQINNSLGGQVIYKGQPQDDYYLTDTGSLGTPLRVLIGNADKSIDTAVFRDMISTLELNRVRTTIEKQADIPITKASSKKRWVTYVNSTYGYEIDVPSGSKLLQEDVNAPYKYTRIQNYNPGEEIYYNLKLGEYYLEINTYDSKLKITPSYSCRDEMVSPVNVSLDGASGHKGSLKPGGGESAPVRYALCIEKDSVIYNLTVSENVSTVSHEIVNSFKFTDNR